MLNASRAARLLDEHVNEIAWRKLPRLSHNWYGDPDSVPY